MRWYGSPRRKSKYGNQRTNGFASKKEAKRSTELDLMVKARVARNLQRQVRFELVSKQEGERSVVYIADFCYELLSAGILGRPPIWEYIVEDVKSPATRKKEAYIIKRKLMLERHGIRIFET